MSQVLSLIQSMWNRANPLASPDKASDGKAATPNNQVPQKHSPSMDPFGIGAKPSGTSAPSPFQAKVQESHAKLAAKVTPPQHDQSRAHLINPAKPKAPTAYKEKETRPEAKPEHNDQAHGSSSDRSDRAEKTDRPDRTQSKGRKDKSAPAKAGAKPDSDSDTKANDVQDRNIQDTGNDAQSARKTADDNTDSDASAANDGQAMTALRDRLEKMGVSATDEQLSDPAFLRDMLKLVQASTPTPDAAADLTDSDAGADSDPGLTMPTPAATTTQATPATTDAITTPALTLAAKPANEATPAQSGVAVPTDATAAAQPQAPVIGNDKNPLAAQAPGQADNQKDLATLIKDRLLEIAKGTEPAAAPSTAASGNPGPSSAEPGSQGWRGMRLGRDDQSVTTDPMPTADLDRMRVMQASAMQAANAGAAKDHVDLSAADSLDTADTAHDVGTVQASSSSNKSANTNANANGNGADAETSGQGQNQAQGAGASTGVAGTHIAREASSGPQFNQTLDQIRSTDHKPAATENIWAPRQTEFDKGILDQISKKMSGVAHLNGEEISIQLEPENLGKVRVGLGLKDGVMTAHIGVESEQIKQIVEASISTLRDTLENQGIKLQGMEVSVDQRHSSLFNPDGSNSQAFFNRHGRGNGGAEGSEIPALESAPESETGRRLGYNTMEYIA